MGIRKERFWLTRDSRSTVVRAAPEVVYDLVADLPRMGEWSPECTAVEWTSVAAPGESGPVADAGAGPADAGPALSGLPVAGATFVGHNRTGPGGIVKWSRRGRVLTAERGREFAFITEESGRESTEWRYTLEPVGGGTRVTESYEVHWLSWGFRFIDVPLNRFGELREAMGHTLEALRVAAEQVETVKSR